MSEGHRVICKLRDHVDLDDLTDSAQIWRDAFKATEIANRHPGVVASRLFQGVSPGDLSEFTAASSESADLMTSVANEPNGRLPNLNSYVLLQVPSTEDVPSLIAELESIDVVEFAYEDSTCEVCALPGAVPLTRVLQQEYLDPAKGGVDIDPLRSAGGDGTGVNFADAEDDWRLHHPDLSHKTVEQLTASGVRTPPIVPFTST